MRAADAVCMARRVAALAEGAEDVGAAGDAGGGAVVRGEVGGVSGLAAAGAELVGAAFNSGAATR